MRKSINYALRIAALAAIVASLSILLAPPAPTHTPYTSALSSLIVSPVYAEHTAREQWQSGDLMLVDNVRTAHGRERFEGPREVLVAMADALNLTDCSPASELTVS